MLKLETKVWVTPLISIISCLIFILDYVTPRGHADYIFYFIPVALSVFHYRPNFSLLVSITSSLLCAIGFFISAENQDIAQAITGQNRIYAIITIWFVGYFVKMIVTSRNQTERTNWLRVGVNNLAETIRGELTSKEVGQKLLLFLSEFLNAKISAIYLRDKNNLNFLTGHAYDMNSAKKVIKLGDGALGQSALDKKIVEFSPLADDHIKVTTSLGTSPISHAIVVPLTADNETTAVLELAFMEKPDTLIMEFLTLIAEPSATAIRSAEHKAKLSELLHQSQQFSEELQAQQEELKVSNEELEQQSKALKATHIRLENQQAEMEQTNQQLEEQAQALESQKNLLDEKNQELQRSKKDLEDKAQELQKASQYKSEFLANMSHELRTPLNSTLILAKLLSDNKSGNLNDEQVKYADIIYNSGNDLLSLINDILDLSKVEAGKMTITPEMINVEQIAKSMEQTFLPVASKKEISFNIEVDVNTPKDIITDRQRLEQILKNFLSNAFKFTSEGTVSLKIYTHENDIAFDVTDSGVGISPHEQEVIFEAFRQADGTTNRKFGGTGLGLSISKELSQILGGEIKVQSTKGKGSTFTLIIPREYKNEEVKYTRPLKQPASEIIKPSPSPASITSKPAQLDFPRFSFKDDRENIKDFNRTMLIIEDDEDFAKILYQVAHEMNFGAIVSPTGAEGMELAKEYVPNAIVLDIRLPDHSGMIVLDQLKMNARTRHIPVHVISSEDFTRSAMEMGAVGYMLKPVKHDKLLTAFQNMNSLLEQKMKHVLVVEDDAVQREHIVNLISDQTVQVDAVESSSEALNKLSQNTYDCMIMDLSLPDMSGHELLSKLSNENTTYSFPPVIVYTARDLTIEEEEQLRLYAGSIIIKGAKSPERLLSEVTLFLHRVETDLPPERQKMLKDLRSRDKGLDDQTILVVDDDVRNIFALTSALEGYGAKVETARNGLEALEKIENLTNIDLVLMDIMMPEMDGYEAMRRIRAMDKHQELPIIALTAKAMKDDKLKCLEAGANDYLPKPLEVDKLLSLIKVWLPQKRRFTS